MTSLLIIILTAVCFYCVARGLEMRKVIMMTRILSMYSEKPRISLRYVVRKAYTKWYDNEFGMSHVFDTDATYRDYANKYTNLWDPLSEAIGTIHAIVAAEKLRKQIEEEVYESAVIGNDAKSCPGNVSGSENV